MSVQVKNVTYKECVEFGIEERLMMMSVNFALCFSELIADIVS